jgi:hypothetical protein
VPIFDLRNSMLGTALWQCFLGIGGDSTVPAVANAPQVLSFARSS